MFSLDGIIWGIKPRGLKPMAYVEKAKTYLGAKKVGYVGALDPYACGVMPLCLGKACKFADYFHSLTKSYLALLSFGVQTDSWDRTGKVQFSTDERSSADDFFSCLGNLKGTIEYPVPPLSSKKVNGHRLYDLFYDGKPVLDLTGEAEVSRTIVFGVEESSQGLEKALVFFEVSKGTYIRGLAKKIGDCLNVPCIVSELVRTNVGCVGLANAVSLEQITPNDVVAIADALYFMPATQIDGLQEQRLKNVGEIPYSNDANAGLTKVFLEERFLGVANIEKGKMAMQTWW
ncbi:hypothetical protein [Coprothermobacter platensis]|uniref:hypothetical protein n=1 Tax=Coprothermobacter platensis TaxID=108819 RepID=UPI0003728DF9|nr:hypothetical protein [Coprothermobacter platensis]